MYSWSAHIILRSIFLSISFSHVGTHPLWQYPLSFPMVPGADTFYNQLAGINSTYAPPSNVRGNGGSSGEKKSVFIIAIIHLFTTHTSHNYTT